MDVVGLFKALTEGLSVGFVASIPLGPIGVLCIQRTLNKGRRSGYVSGLGAATSDFLYAVVAGFSVSIVTNFVERYRGFLMVAGAIVLICLGLKMMLYNPIKQLRRRQDKKSKSLWQDYASTFFLTFSNPLALFVFLAAFSLLQSEMGSAEHLLVVLGVFFGAAAWWLCLVLMVGLFRKKLTIRRLLYLNRIAGGIIIVLVVLTLLNEVVHFF